MIGHSKARKPPKRKEWMNRSGRIKPKKRSPKDYARIYGSKSRVEWMKGEPCIALQSSCSGEIQGHHIITGGTSRKADAKYIVPLCAGHHSMLHGMGATSFQTVFQVTLLAEAARVAALWDARECAA